MEQFEPEDLLEHLDLDDLTIRQAAEEIWRLTSGSRDRMSPGYYSQRLGAIEILSVVIMERSPDQQEQPE